MSLICGCPAGTEIDDIPSSACQQDFGQVQKVMFQRIYSTGTTKNEIVISTTNPNLLATWTTLKSASDGTKVTVSPYISTPETEPGSKREFGGGNATIGGIPIVMGREPTSFTGQLFTFKQDVIAALKKYECENIGVFLINEHGHIAGDTDDLGTPTKFLPIPIKSLFIGDKNLGGFEEPDSNAIEWSFLPNWSDKFHVVTPTDFNAVTDL